MITIYLISVDNLLQLIDSLSRNLHFLILLDGVYGVVFLLSMLLS